jgi:hypothetical protein
MDTTEMDDQIEQLQNLETEIDDKVTSAKVRKWAAMAELMKLKLQKNETPEVVELACKMLFDLAIEVAESKR